MVSADDVRSVGLALPRTYEFFTGGRYKLKVRQIVYAAFSKDETDLGFQWVCAHLERLDAVEMRELVTDAWRMCTPKMLHDLPEMEPPAAAAWAAIDADEWDDVRRLLHPDLRFQ